MHTATTISHPIITHYVRTLGVGQFTTLLCTAVTFASAAVSIHIADATCRATLRARRAATVRVCFHAVLVPVSA